MEDFFRKQQNVHIGRLISYQSAKLNILGLFFGSTCYHTLNTGLYHRYFGDHGLRSLGTSGVHSSEGMKQEQKLKEQKILQAWHVWCPNSPISPRSNCICVRACAARMTLHPQPHGIIHLVELLVRRITCTERRTMHFLLLLSFKTETATLSMSALVELIVGRFDESIHIYRSSSVHRTSQDTHVSDVY